MLPSIVFIISSISYIVLASNIEGILIERTLLNTQESSSNKIGFPKVFKRLDRAIYCGRNSRCLSYIDGYNSQGGGVDRDSRKNLKDQGAPTYIGIGPGSRVGGSFDSDSDSNAVIKQLVKNIGIVQ